MEAYKERKKVEIASEDYRVGVSNYFILRKLAATADFFIPEPEQADDQIEDAQLVDQNEEDQA